jgi:hypothetical protein
MFSEMIHEQSPNPWHTAGVKRERERKAPRENYYSDMSLKPNYFAYDPTDPSYDFMAPSYDHTPIAGHCK